MKVLAKKALFAAITALLISNSCPTPSFAQSDQPSSWAKEDVSEAWDRLLVPTELNIQYQLALTRAQFGEMAIQLYEVLTNRKAVAPGKNPFRDMNNYRVLQAYELGIVKGTSSTTFSPNTEVNREQLALMLYNTLKKAGLANKLEADLGDVPRFADDKQISSWSRDAIKILNGSQLMKGSAFKDQIWFMPKTTTTREQAIVLVNRIYEKYGTYYVNNEYDLMHAFELNQNLPIVIMDARSKQIYEKAKSILGAIIKPGMSEYDRELAIHNYLLLHLAYDYENYKNGTIPDDSYTIYGALFKGIAVCQGYAYSAKLLLSMAGIETHIVTGTAKGIAHAWNKVKIGGSYYNLDVTWDDPVPDVDGRLAYGYFNVTDEELERDHIWSDDLPKALASASNYFVYNGLTVASASEFEARVIAAIQVQASTITLKRTYKNAQGANDWYALISRFPEVAKYSYTTDNSGVVSFTFIYR
ncbi:hypothetical protein Back11_41410 [Paenibacillus baekrokdamisoli]|uniref:Uncharacterized protein n=1 Tax=Paenibacillus baekrokdamisoli TaxID=1712516 RepID=A0A3G9IWA7_9BACL|nr:S-layer homology domain-containing protein [Paenibacillus baekrokdamisoli]MBB3068159.1 hypothetical protein [Paenibacillus baekrokdamisoli]BBH22796.1 hypothetical protein Back11_41410 [Paenibacillus baekrokdamisoli]